MKSEMTKRVVELADKGGHFYRADFQVHTPRDTQWDGVRPTDRDVWADDFVAAARKQGLNAVAISDHHDFAYFPYIKRAAAREKLPDGTNVPDLDRLVVFPALELTLSVPCQAIMILDADFPEDRLDDVLKVMNVDPIDPRIKVVPQTRQLNDSSDINRFHEKLDNYSWLKGRYIILPNVTPGGYKTLLRNAFQDKYATMPSVGGYLDGSITQLERDRGKKRILDGRDRNWGSKRLALFQTSDARKSDFSTLGECATWVKWARPTAEAIRQACLAQESRISYEQPSMPNFWISRIRVSDSKFLGHIDVSFNPQYTALIGGRGTGKSTILDYLRWALCDQPPQATDVDEVADPLVRQRKLVDATLKPCEAWVEVYCTINGIGHIVRRYAKDGTVKLKVGDDEFKTVTEAVIQSLLPIQAYSQKQLSSVAIRTDELLRFVTSPIQCKLEEIDRKREEVVGRLRENYATLQRCRTLSSEIERGDLRVSSIAEQLQALRNSLVGISRADRKILDSKGKYDELRSARSVWLRSVESAQIDLAKLFESLDSSLEQISMPASVLRLSPMTPMHCSFRCGRL